ncbi:uncharacterized protein LOC113094469 isoform X2 [Carassius auratus]|nr:uncharacterized protein LOC113039487 isoform X2 [Carassius auratus]XP_026053169.1 uncharacterized protein LOC113039487 isoform X2 [Carassius auratus]XP_026053222.1 uncharacterized protein LOC113039533 isoform X2 [Carassius auratus]XP_026053223.1 uncharacterized protein LOC113039533 isoform X2 [Carassius auratus]XP_026115866.1 uncharacterized protein LOC113094469 isoform X2 [Carassius auratus]XP_026115867.1 uncharacterized protein LOC113094469 isoform X2 [Carassius auratus]XP_026115868.1 un
MAHPYSTPQKLALKCIQTRLIQKAGSFVRRGFKITIDTQHTSTVCALTDGSRAIYHKKNGSYPEFEEGASYILKNCTLSDRHGRLCLLVGRSTLKFRTAPLKISEEAERAAVELIHPPSYSATGEEEDLFSRSGYLSLLGKVEKIQKVRMTMSDIPVLDLKMKCGERLLDVSLWRDEALSELHEGDNVHISHMRATILASGNAKLQSSNYTTIKIEEVEPVEQEVEVVGVTEIDDNCHLLTADDEIFVVPSEHYCGSIDDLIMELPMKIIVNHVNKRVVSVQTVN